MKTIHIFILFIFVLFIVGIWDIKGSYNNYIRAPSYPTISSFYSKIAGIILSLILLILYLLGYVNIPET